jgi:hypothetical protein
VRQRIASDGPRVCPHHREPRHIEGALLKERVSVAVIIPFPVPGSESNVDKNNLRFFYGIDAGNVKRENPPESTTLFRNPAAGADIPAFDTSRAVGDIVCLLHHNILFSHIKHESLLLGVVDSGCLR